MTTASSSTPSRSGSWARLRLNARLEVDAPDAQARALLDGTAGLLYLVSHRLLAPSIQAELDKALAQALHGAIWVGHIRRSGGMPITLCLEPFHTGRDVLVTIRDGQAEQACEACLQTLYGLTPSEAGVTAALSLGLRSTEIAVLLGIQPNTVLAHIKKVLAKTGAPHQVALLALVLRSVAMQHEHHAHHSPDPNGPRSI